MRQEEQKITLATLGGGGAEELFQQALEQVLWNIQDVNTEPQAVRKITLEVAFTPDTNREIAKLTYQVKTKLAPHAKQEGTALLGMEDGTPVAAEYRPEDRQTTIEDFIPSADKVTPINKEA